MALLIHISFFIPPFYLPLSLPLSTLSSLPPPHPSIPPFLSLHPSLSTPLSFSPPISFFSVTLFQLIKIIKHSSLAPVVSIG